MKKIFILILFLLVSSPLFARIAYDDERIFTRAQVTKIRKHRIAIITYSSYLYTHTAGNAGMDNI